LPLTRHRVMDEGKSEFILYRARRFKSNTSIWIVGIRFQTH
jgi:hypothetical protein